MSRGVARMPVYLGDSDRADFLERVRSTVEEGRLVVHAFCLMPNHSHLLCETPRGELRTLIREINGGYARRFNRVHRRRGHLWQGWDKAILVEDGRTLIPRQGPICFVACVAAVLTYQGVRSAPRSLSPRTWALLAGLGNHTFWILSRD